MTLNHVLRGISTLALALTLAAPATAQTRSAAFVAQVKADLIDRGLIPTVQGTNCDAFQITGRVAWALRDQGAKLIPKTAAQNGCVWKGAKYSLDAIAFADGWADVLVGAGPPQNENRPAWQFTASGPSAGAVAPIDLDAGAGPVVTPPPTDPVLPPQIVTELLAKLLMEVQQLRLNSEALMAALAAVRAEQTDSKIQHAHGLSGTLFGYPITLKPTP